MLTYRPVRYFSVYERTGRPFYFLSYVDATTGKRIHRSTVHRISDPRGHKKAFDQGAELARKAAAYLPSGPAEAWATWVPAWVRIKYTGGSLARFNTAWAHLEEFLSEKELASPRAVQYEHAEGYLTWRTGQKRPRGTFINFNTALTELRFLGAVMKEAVRRGLAPGNPIAQLGLGRRDVKEKPEITDEEDAKIRLELASRPVWMREAYQVAICQGCRLRETMVPMSQIDLARNAITFKGKGNKVFTTTIHPSLRPLVDAKKKIGSRYLVDIPPMPSKSWWKFFGEVGLPHLCFHCTKVTVITRLCRAGVPQGVAMSYVNHSTEEVHRIYQRLQIKDVGIAVAALGSIPVIGEMPGEPLPTPQIAEVKYKVRRQKVSPEPA